MPGHPASLSIRGLAVTGLALAVCFPSSASAAAVDASGPAVCNAQVTVALKPGVSTNSGSFDYASNGQNGTITCQGEVNGSPVTGPGTVEDRGKGSGSCMGGKVEGVNIVTIPTAKGPQTFTIPVRADFNGPLGIRNPAPDYPGGFLFAPTKGDCVTGPITEVIVQIPGILLP
ncbi:MAG: hypothetical protein ACT4QG_06240 [Sporichthyaceae bacterium]